MSNSVPTFSKAIYDCALECAAQRAHKKCRNNFNSSACSKCRFYIKKYINIDPAQADLLMMQAESTIDMRIFRVENHKRNDRMVAIILITILLFCIFTIHKNIKKSEERRYANYKSQTILQIKQDVSLFNLEKIGIIVV